MAFGTNLPVFTDLLEKCRRAASIPLIVKLSPNVTSIAEFAARAEETGADALSAVNTFLGMKIDIKNRRPYFNNRFAGLSGPAIKPMAVRCVYQIYEAVSIPVIGLGGIASLEDVIEFIMAGAAAVSVGTMNMIDPMLALRLTDELAEYMNSNGITEISGLTGSAHPQ
jgi:dihydroorotate dehydrogenase (NAD+) catalytic subunit